MYLALSPTAAGPVGASVVAVSAPPPPAPLPDTDCLLPPHQTECVFSPFFYLCWPAGSTPPSVSASLTAGSGSGPWGMGHRDWDPPPSRSTVHAGNPGPGTQAGPVGHVHALTAASGGHPRRHVLLVPREDARAQSRSLSQLGASIPVPLLGAAVLGLAAFGELREPGATRSLAGLHIPLQPHGFKRSGAHSEHMLAPPGLAPGPAVLSGVPKGPGWSGLLVGTG